VLLAILLLLIYFVLSVLARNKGKGRNLPPAPKWRLPIIGHAAYLDKDKPFEQIDKWSKELGDVMTVHF
ncbi:hypothetical protein PMAYCL1PPCAC_15875, partial [Pristionchus mayeri]